jgi:hypothetical protein
MAGKKTLDEIKIRGIVKAAIKKPLITYREATNHVYMLNYPGLRPCPVATSTHARRMVVPWVARATGLPTQEVYTALKRGRW